jgi:hypothetical protein
MNFTDVVELTRLDSLERAYDLKCELAARGLQALVVDRCSRGWVGAGSRTHKVLISARDLVYARWIADSIGIDAWPVVEKQRVEGQSRLV